MMNNSGSNNSTLIKSLCAIVFILFSFFYLYFFQADILAMQQNVLSGGTTHYNKTIGAILITLVLYLIKTGVSRITKFSGALYALTYMPSALLLIFLTCPNNNFSKDNMSGTWTWLSIVIFIVFCFFSFMYKRWKQQSPTPYIKETTAGLVWKNMLLMALTFFLICIGGNTDRVFHYRMRAEALLSSGKYKEALEVGNKSHDTDESLTMLRIYALSRSKQLGESLFKYPIAEGGSASLLPNGNNVKCMLLPKSEIFKQLGIRKKGNMQPMEYLLYLERNGLAMKSVTDYILCGYLLDKNLNAFVNEITKKYNINSPSLPRHYKEALILYTHLRANPAAVLHDEVMDADYDDFQKLEKKFKDKNERLSYVKDTYGETYWFYYFYHV